MAELTENELESYAQKILNDYDLKNPSILCKNNINISVVDAYKTVS